MLVVYMFPSLIRFCCSPCIGWLRTYKTVWLIKDLIAGISVGFMVQKLPGC